VKRQLKPVAFAPTVVTKKKVKTRQQQNPKKKKLLLFLKNRRLKFRELNSEKTNAPTDDVIFAPQQLQRTIIVKSNNKYT
jgi:hypothetical protein